MAETTGFVQKQVGIEQKQQGLDRNNGGEERGLGRKDTGEAETTGVEAEATGVGQKHQGQVPYLIFLSVHILVFLVVSKVVMLSEGNKKIITEQNLSEGKHEL